MAKKGMTYAESMAQIEKILARFRNEEIAARERGLRRAAHGIDPALPAGRGTSGLFFGDNGIINGGHSVNIGCRSLSEGNWHGILLCVN